ncbi:MAG: hypothetical protein ACLTML_06110 [Blautia faecis]
MKITITEILYPLNQKEYEAVQKVFDLTGKVSEKDIADITENKKYKPSEWVNYTPTVCCVGSAWLFVRKGQE